MENSIQYKKDNYPLHILLFLLTVFSTMLAGADLVSSEIGREGGFISHLFQGGTFSLFFLAFLTFHEFGHYFTARYHDIKCSLPYYIPVPSFIFPSLIGTLGAVIRLRQKPESTKVTFDIGIAGPLAGFVVAVLLLIYGFSTLPPLGEYVGNIHPNYEEEFGGIPTEEELIASPNYQTSMSIGSNLLYNGLAKVFVSDPKQLPPPWEMMHYPALFVGFLALFFTALNMLPIGQLDGGHVIFGLFGRKVASIVSRCTVMVLLFLGGAGNLNFFNFPTDEAVPYNIWLYGKMFPALIYGGIVFWVVYKLFSKEGWATLIGLFILFMLLGLVLNFVVGGIESNFIWMFFGLFTTFFIGVDHPPVLYEEKLSPGRIFLGWLSLVILVVSFSFSPIYISS